MPSLWRALIKTQIVYRMYPNNTQSFRCKWRTPILIGQCAQKDFWGTFGLQEVRLKTISADIARVGRAHHAVANDANYGYCGLLCTTRMTMARSRFMSATRPRTSPNIAIRSVISPIDAFTFVSPLVVSTASFRSRSGEAF